MKKMNKKIISLILAMMMILSTMAVGIGSIDFAGSLAVKANAVYYGKEYEVGDFLFKFEDTLDRVYISGTKDTISGEVEIPIIVSIEGKNYPVIALGSESFMGRTNVTKVTLSSNVLEIREYAFKGCTNLETLELDKYDHLGSIGIYAFYGCEKLSIVGAEEEETETDEEGNETVVGTDWTTTLAHVTSIGDYAFYGCSSLCVLYFPAATYIGAYAFCKSGLVQLILPSGITEVNEYTFANCTNLVEAAYEGEIKSIGEHAFDGCYYLGEFIPNNTNNYKVEAIEKYSELFNFEYETVNVIDIPDNCTTVGDFAFFNCDSIYRVDIPADAVLGMASISAMNNLKEFNVEGNNYTTDGIALYTADKKTLVQYGLACPITSYEVESGVKNIAPYAFYGSINLRTVTLPASLTAIGESAFNSSLALRKIDAGDSAISNIDMLAFANCPKLEEIYVPFSLKDGKVDESIYSNSNSGNTITVYCETGLSDAELEKATEDKTKFEALFSEPGEIVYLTTDSVVITFDLNGGVSDTTEGDVVVICSKGDVVTAPEVIRAGYTLDSWSPAIEEAEESITYHAIWVPDAHKDHNLEKSTKYDETGHGIDILCTDCNIVVSRGVIWDHNLEEAYVDDVAPTCTTAGSNNKKWACTDCEYTYETKVTVAALGHDNTKLVGGSEVAATCTTPATAKYECSRCGKTVTQETAPALGHNYVYTVEPTCEVPGIAVCSRCSAKTAVPAAGHIDENKDAICDVCGAVIISDIVVSIKRPKTTVIPYGHSLVLTAKTNAADRIPDGCSLVWEIVEDETKNPDAVVLNISDDGMTCEVKAVKSGKAVVMVKLCDASGNIVSFENGRTVSDTVSVSTNVNFYQMVIYFFKTIFFMNKKIY